MHTSTHTNTVNCSSFQLMLTHARFIARVVHQSPPTTSSTVSSSSSTSLPSLSRMFPMPSLCSWIAKYVGGLPLVLGWLK